jgi:hypothetical protein
LEGLELALFLTGEMALMNLVLVLRLTRSPSHGEVKSVLRAIQARHPLLRSRVVKKGGSYRFETGDVTCVPVTTKRREGNDDWRGVAEKELIKGFESVEEPLLRAILLGERDGGGRGELLLTIHHAIADGPACKEIVGQLLAGCGITYDPDSPPDDTPQPFPPGVEERFPAFFRGARRLTSMSDFVARQAADEALYRIRTMGRRPALVTGPSPCRILTLRLDRKSSSRLPRACARHQVTINSALQAAALLAVSRELYDGSRAPLRYVEFPDLRPFLEPPVEPQTVANYSSTVRFTHWVEGDLDLWQLAADIQQRSHRAYRRGDKFCSAVSSPTMIRTLLKQSSVRMGTTALSYVGPMLLDPDPGPERILDLHAFVSNFPLGPEFTAQVRWLRGQLAWDVVFLDTDMDRPQAEVVVHEALRLLAAAAADRAEVMA